MSIAHGNMAIFIGEVIKEKVQEKNVTVTWLAKQLGCHRTNIYRIFKSASIDTNVLLKLSNALGYDFFELYSSSVNDSL